MGSVGCADGQGKEAQRKVVCRGARKRGGAREIGVISDIGIIGGIGGAGRGRGNIPIILIAYPPLPRYPSKGRG